MFRPAIRFALHSDHKSSYLGDIAVVLFNSKHLPSTNISELNGLPSTMSYVVLKQLVQVTKTKQKFDRSTDQRSEKNTTTDMVNSVVMQAQNMCT